jgi:hypothetical protein
MQNGHVAAAAFFKPLLTSVFALFSLSSVRSRVVQFDSYTFNNLRSEVSYRSDLLQPWLTPSISVVADTKPSKASSPLSHLPLTDYFGALAHTQPTNRAYKLEPHTRNEQEEEEQRPQQELQQAQEQAAPAQHGRIATPVVAFRPSSHFWLLLCGGAAALLLSSLVLDRGSSHHAPQRLKSS